MGQLNRRKTKNTQPSQEKSPSADDDLKKLVNSALPFGALQAVKWIIIILDIGFCFYITNELWQQAVVTEHHSRIYFVAMGYLYIALAQLFFIAVFYSIKLLSRFIRH